MATAEHEVQDHPFAGVFPLLSGEDLQSLAADIKLNGLNHSVTLFEDKILDGRNRYRACLLVDVEPRFDYFHGDSGKALLHVWSENAARRHLTSSQWAACKVEFDKHTEDLRAAALERKREGNAKGGQNKSSQLIDLTSKQDNTKRTDAILAGGETNRTYVAQARKLKEEDPETYEKVKGGEKTLTQVAREKKEAERERKRAENAAKVQQTEDVTALAGVFSTLVIDPPWDWGDEGDADPCARSKPTYATMSIADLHDLPIGEKAADDAHVYLWVTNRSLPKAFALLESWGFRYITCLTWCKPSFGLGLYFRGSTEQVLFGVRGSLPLKRKDVGTWFEAPRGPNGHSSKPTEFYDLVESCSPGPYLEIFSRNTGKREDWTAWGAEV